MKKIKKFIKSNMKVVIAFILGGITIGTGGAYAATVIAGSNIEYSNTASGLSATTVQGAIDEIYEKSKTHCPDGYKCTEILPICKKATTLHTDLNGTTTFGTISTDSLKTGDAFDCDVNGDGVYNEENERFYYISDLEENSDYAILIYYNSVENGEPVNAGLAYDANYDGVANGPITCRDNMPTITQWKNVSLYKSVRNILDDNDQVIVENFSYEGYAARLLTLKELSYACGGNGEKNVGNLDSTCGFIMENTNDTGQALRNNFGIRLETYVSEDTQYAWYVFRNYTFHGGNVLNPAVSARPVIEILKSSIKI